MVMQFRIFLKVTRRAHVNQCQGKCSGRRRRRRFDLVRRLPDRSWLATRRLLRRTDVPDERDYRGGEESVVIFDTAAVVVFRRRPTLKAYSHWYDTTK